MKKNLLIAVLALLSILSTAFAYYQRERADRYAVLALKNELLANEMKIQAEEQTKIAERERQSSQINAFEAMFYQSLHRELKDKK